MKKALYIPDAHVRQMVEAVKNLHDFKSLRETVEAGMQSLLREHENRQQSFHEIATSLQKETRQFLRNRYPSGQAHDHKAFFDALNGEA